MKAKERILAVYDDQGREKLDKVPSNVQYVAPEFISKYKDYFLNAYDKNVFIQYFGVPYYLGFDSVFAPIPSNIEFKNIRVELNSGKNVKIGIDGQSVKRKTDYYEGGYVDSLQILEQMKKNLTIVDKKKEIREVLKSYEKIEDYIYPIVMVNGIFDRVWQAMGITEFSKHFHKKSELYRGLIKFYAKIMNIKIKGLIDASDGSKRLITILDDVAYKDRAMISPEQWEKDFLPHYEAINTLITESGMIPQVHTDGDPTDLIPLFQKAGFQGLQGWEGSADPFNINKQYPDFVVMGFGDVSHILPYGRSTQIEAHVRRLMDALKENRYYIIGPSTIIYEKIPLENIQTFMKALKKYGKYS
jgi:uroporphyrinogen-III decarboxylase